MNNFSRSNSNSVAPFEYPGADLIKSDDELRFNLWAVSPKHLAPCPRNPQITTSPLYDAEVREIADRIKKDGYDSNAPMMGYPGEIGGTKVVFIADGIKRLKAIELALSEGSELDRIPVAIEQELKKSKQLRP